MKTVILTIVCTLAITPKSYALHYLNCSNMDSSAQIVEHEIWGANPVSCYYKGVELKNATVRLQKATKMVVDYQQNGPVADLDWEKTFTIKALFSIPENSDGNGSDNMRELMETHLICQEVSTSALDLVGPTSHCKVIYEEE